MTTKIVAVEPNAAAGGLVYWSLTGAVEYQDLVETLTAEGLEALAPAAPSKEACLARGMRACVQSQRQLVRPLGSRAAGYVLVQEDVLSSDDQRPDERNLEYRERVVGYVENDEFHVRSVNDQMDSALAQAVFAEAHAAEGVLTSTDISSWLLTVLHKHVEAVTLRDRGGFYFVPAHRLDTWRQVARVVRACSAHTMFEIPAMRTDEAVAAILTGLRAEAAKLMTETEAYLAGEVSTRGLNAQEAKLTTVQEKLAHYAELLGQAQPDLVEKAATLQGAVQAARLIRDNDDAVKAA